MAAVIKTIVDGSNAQQSTLTNVVQRISPEKASLPPQLFVDATKPFHEALEESNRSKGENALLAIVIQAAYDPDQSLSSTAWRWNVLEIAKTHPVAFNIIHTRAAIPEIMTLLGSQAELVIIHGHGEPNCVHFRAGREGLYHTAHVQEKDFAALSSKASIIFKSCCVGQGLARGVATVCKRRVLAVEKGTNINFYVHRAEEGWSLTSLNSEDHRYIKVFERNGSIKNPVFAITDNEKQSRGDYIVRRALLGDIGAQFDLALLYDYQQMPAPAGKSFAMTAAEWYERAAENGDMRSQYNLAALYTNQEIPAPVGKSSPEAAAEWYEKAANQGNKDAQFSLAGLHEKRQIPAPVGKSSAEAAAEWYEKAAKQGCKKAQEKWARLKEKPPIPAPSGKSSAIKAAKQGRLTQARDNRAALYNRLMEESFKAQFADYRYFHRSWIASSPCLTHSQKIG